MRHECIGCYGTKCTYCDREYQNAIDAGIYVQPHVPVITEKYWYCECGQYLEDEWKFCPNCGTWLNWDNVEGEQNE